MSRPEIPQLHLAKAPFEFKDGFTVLAIRENAGSDIEPTAVADHWTVGEITNAGNYDQTTIRLALSAADVDYLETGAVGAAAPEAPPLDTIGQVEVKPVAGPLVP